MFLKEHEKTDPSFYDDFFITEGRIIFYGNYSGKWSLDTFYFKEENLTIEMKYLDIYYIKENILNIDGVLGLGSYIKQDANIYYNINQTTNNCFNKISTYDRKSKKIIICDTDTSSKLNNFVIDFSYNTFNYPGLITITKLDLLTNNKEIGLFAYKLSFPHPITKEIISFSYIPLNSPFNYFDLSSVKNLDI